MSHPEKETVYHPMAPEGDPEPMEYVRYDLHDQLRELCKELAEALDDVMEDGLKTNMREWQKQTESALAKYKQALEPTKRV